MIGVDVRLLEPFRRGSVRERGAVSWGRVVELRTQGPLEVVGCYFLQKHQKHALFGEVFMKLVCKY